MTLPLHEEEAVQDVDTAILSAVLSYAEDRRRLGNESYSVELAIAEAAARYPERFVAFCVNRCENEFTGVSLLPPHLDIDTERMQDSEGYDTAVARVCDLIMDLRGIIRSSSVISLGCS